MKLARKVSPNYAFQATSSKKLDLVMRQQEHPISDFAAQHHMRDLSKGVQSGATFGVPNEQVQSKQMQGDAPNFGGNISDKENVSRNSRHNHQSDANGSSPTEAQAPRSKQPSHL